MTEREFTVLDDTRLEVFARAGWKCEVCHVPLNLVSHPQLAHRIPQNTRNLVKYGKRIIHHHLNLAATCCLACNAKVDIRHHPKEIEALVSRIKHDLGVL